MRMYYYEASPVEIDIEALLSVQTHSHNVQLKSLKVIYFYPKFLDRHLMSLH